MDDSGISEKPGQNWHSNVPKQSLRTDEKVLLVKNSFDIQGVPPKIYIYTITHFE